MAFKLENFGAEVANAKSTLGGICYYRYFNEENNTLTTAGYFPATLGLEVGDRIRVIPSVKTNADEMYVVTSTANRTVTVTQIDTDGAVDSVNGKTGTVVLTAEDINAIPQLTTMPTASVDLNGKIVQYTGATDATYTNGYFYKCAGAGEPVVYSWTRIDVQPAPSGLPSQTGNAGKFLTTDGTDASWSDTIEDNKIIVKNTASSQYAYVDQIAFYAKYNNSNGTASTIRTINGGGFEFSGDLQTQNIAAASNGKNLGSSFRKWANVYTTKINNGADITVPNQAGTMVVATPPTTDGTYVLKATVASGVVTYAWVAE